MNKVIVSRHPAAIEFIARELGDKCIYLEGRTIRLPNGEVGKAVPTLLESENGNTIPVIAQATADDVRGKHVIGNLPLHLAAIAAKVTVIEFTGTPPRGQEYSLADMDAAGAVLRSYTVTAATGD